VRPFFIAKYVVGEVLGRPESYIWSGSEKILVDRMGIKREKPDENPPALQLPIIA
jgi:hypothetical protein